MIGHRLDVDVSTARCAIAISNVYSMPARPMNLPWPLRIRSCSAKTKQIAHQFAEFAVAAVDDQFEPQNRQWRRAVTPAHLTRGRTAGMAGEAESGTLAC